MHEGKERRKRSILFALMFIISMVVATTSAVFTFLLVQYRTKDLIDLVDSRLLTAAELTRERLGPDYHDRIVDKTSVSKEEFSRIVARNDDLCRRLNLQYLWSVLLVENRLVFTSATHSDLNNPESPCASFFETHHDPESFASVLHSEFKTSFSSFKNEWGEGRMVLIPRKDARGRTYIFGASVQLRELNAMVRRTVITSTGIGLAVICGSFLLALVLARSFTVPIASLTKAAARMAIGDFDVSLGSARTHELQSLSNSLEQMRQGLKRQLAELQESEERFKLSMEATNDGLWDWNIKTDEAYFSPAYYRMLGYELGAFPGKGDAWKELIHPDDLEHALQANMDCVEGRRELFEVEYRMKAKNGEWQWILSRGKCIARDEHGHALRLVGTHVDITERKQGEMELKESEEKFRLTFNSSPDAVNINRLENGLYVDINDGFTNLTGFTRKDVIGKTSLGINIWHNPADRQKLVRGLREKGFYENLEAVFRRKDGSLTTALMSARIISLKGLEHIISITRDISERKKIEKALFESQERLKEAHRLAQIGVWNWIAATDTVTWSEQLYHIAGLDINLPTPTFAEHARLFAPESWTRLKAVVEKAMETGEPYQLELELIRPDGASRWVHAFGGAAYDPQGRIIGLQGTLQDITERKRAEEALGKSEELYRSLFENMLNGFAYCRMLFEDGKPQDFIYLAVNDAFESLTGLKNVVGRKVTEVIPGIREADPQLFEIYGRVAVTGQPERFEMFVEALQMWFWISVYSPAHEHFVAVFDVVTERKQAEQALRESSTRFRSIVENSAAGYFFIDREGCFQTVNAAWLRLHKYDSPEEILGRQFSVTQVDADLSRANETVERLLVGEVAVQGEFTRRCKDGSIGWHTFSANPVQQGGKVVGLEGFLIDITERKQIEEVQAFLAQTSIGTADEPFFEGLARYLAKSLGMDFVCIDRLEGDGLTARTIAVWCDGKFEDNVTYALKDTPCGDVVGKTICCFPASVCQLFQRDQLLQDLGGESYVGVTLWSHTGQPIGLIAVIGRSPLENRPLAEAMLKLVAVRAAGELERLDAEEALRHERDRAQGYLDTVETIIVALNTEGRITTINRKGCQLFGCGEDELIGQLWFSTCLPQPDGMEKVYPVFLKIIAGELESLEYFENPIVTRSGELRQIAWHNASLRDEQGWIIGTLSSGDDITERKRAEEEKAKLEAQLLQAQKMESVGRLAGGVAHDFNNMLLVILGHVEMALEQEDLVQPIHAHLEEIHEAAERSADLIRQLLAFARKQMVAPKVLDLNETIAGMLKMLQRLIGENILLNWQPKADLWPVRMDPSQIDQILANLCVNARDAIADVGKITIETGNSAFDEAYCDDHPGFVPGEYVRLAVSDNGCGMDKETLAHIFEPFFTTKGVGEGTGLGLATVYGAVRQNNGYINAYSEPGHGTTFTIYLPRHVGKAGQARTEGAAGPLRRGQETILLVEDERTILKLTKRMLETQGYIVLSAPTPGEAIRLARERGGEIHLLITDMVMPEMNGRDLAKNLLSLYPHLKCLFMPGYTADVIAHHGVLDEGVHFIQKPFSIQNLAAKVREVLDSE